MRRYALVVGANQVRIRGYNELKRASYDAQRVAGLVRESPGWELPTLLTEEIGSQSLQLATNNLVRNTKNDDFILFYFSGHGEIHNDELHFVVADALIPASIILDNVLIRSSQVGAMVVLECCFSGKATDNLMTKIFSRIPLFEKKTRHIHRWKRASTFCLYLCKGIRIWR